MCLIAVGAGFFAISSDFYIVSSLKVPGIFSRSIFARTALVGSDGGINDTDRPF
jgi:hypothetical protein